MVCATMWRTSYPIPSSLAFTTSNPLVLKCATFSAKNQRALLSSSNRSFEHQARPVAIETPLLSGGTDVLARKPPQTMSNGVLVVHNLAHIGENLEIASVHARPKHALRVGIHFHVRCALNSIAPLKGEAANSAEELSRQFPACISSLEKKKE